MSGDQVTTQRLRWSTLVLGRPTRRHRRGPRRTSLRATFSLSAHPADRLLHRVRGPCAQMTFLPVRCHEISQEGISFFYPGGTRMRNCCCLLGSQGLGNTGCGPRSSYHVPAQAVYLFDPTSAVNERFLSADSCGDSKLNRNRTPATIDLTRSALGRLLASRRSWQPYRIVAAWLVAHWARSVTSWMNFVQGRGGGNAGWVRLATSCNKPRCQARLRRIAGKSRRGKFQWRRFQQQCVDGR